MRRVLEREYQVYGKAEFQRLAGISASHIYNLRESVTYRNCRVRVQHTQARQVSIAERRKPDARGRPGYLRVDTVHQGNQDGRPGLYHLNAVDTVTQWQVLGRVETISERHLKPVLEAMLHQFPFPSGAPRRKPFRSSTRPVSWLENWQQYLKEGLRPELLERQAQRMSDTDAAERMLNRKLALLAQCRRMK